MKRLCPITILVALLLLGCTTAAEKRYFQLHIPPPQNAAKTPSIPRTVMVKNALVEKAYDEYRLVYRYSPYQLDYYNYEYWIEKPSRMIRKVVADYLRKRNVFTRVLHGNANDAAQWFIEPSVAALEEFDRNRHWYAHLAMTIHIRDKITGRILVSHSFNRMDRLSRRDSRLLPRLLSEILRTEMDELIRKLHSKVSDLP